MNERLQNILSDYINGGKLNRLGDQLLKYRRETTYCEDWRNVQTYISEFIDNSRWDENQLRLKLFKYMESRFNRVQSL